MSPTSASQPRRLTLAVSSRTGNTQKVAEAVQSELESLGWDVHVRERGEEITDDTVIVCFWCWKSCFDPVNAKIVAGMQGRRVLAFGTFGGYPDSPYAERVRGKVTDSVESAGNTCLGVFLSQGKVSTARIEERKRLPVDDPHHLDEAGVARIMESQKHPNEDDIRRAVAFLHDHLDEL